jgi:hypothetical protein
MLASPIGLLVAAAIGNAWDLILFLVAPRKP